MLPYLIAGAIGYGIAKLFEEDKTPKYNDGGEVKDYWENKGIKTYLESLGFKIGINGIVTYESVEAILWLQRKYETIKDSVFIVEVGLPNEPYNTEDYGLKIAVLDNINNLSNAKKGLASFVLDKIIEGADLTQTTLQVIPKQMDKLGLTTKQLIDWYSKRGFKPIDDGIVYERKALKIDSNELKMENGVLLAPNGKPSNLTPEQYKLVRTKAFKDWFGDWENDPENASKVVDENGEPLVCNHSSREKNIDIFYGGRIFRTKLNEVKPIWFTYKKGNVYADDEDVFQYQVFLNITNLFDYSNEGDLIKLKNYFSEKNKQELPDYDFNMDWEEQEQFNLPAYVFEMGYDGYKFTDEYSIVVFNSSQIKLADGTNTTFDGNNPDIRFDGGGSVSNKYTDGGLTLQEVEIRIDNFILWFEDNGWKQLNQEETIEVGLGGVDDYFWIEGYTFQSPNKNVLVQFSRQARLMLDDVRAKKIWFRRREREPIIILDTLLVKEKGKGEGSKTIKLITELSNKFGVVIHLEPKPIRTDEYLNKEQLYQFYLKSGFEVLYDKGYDKIMEYKPNSVANYDGGGNVNSGAFRKWFGNSKVVDKKGNPLIVYHGSPDLRALKEKYIFESRFLDNQSFFFTDNYSMAKSYADPKRAFDYQNAEEGVIRLYLSLQNPLIVNAFNQIWRKFEITIDGNEIIGTRNLINFAKNKGYDGVIVENVRDYYNNNDKKTKGGNVYVAFYPNQIKLADGTNTTFDGNNPDIRFDGGGEVYSKHFIDNLADDIIHKTDAMEQGAWWDYDEPENVSINNVKRFIHKIFETDWEKGGLKNIPNIIKLYRVVFLRNEKELKSEFLGHHWVRNEKLLKTHIADIMGQFNLQPNHKESQYMITADFKKDDIDIYNTIYHNVSIDHEEEVTIKKDAKPINYSLKKF